MWLLGADFGPGPKAISDGGLVLHGSVGSYVDSLALLQRLGASSG